MQTNKIFSIIFFTRKLRSHIDKLSIYARIAVNGKRSEISLKRFELSKDWDSAKSWVCITQIKQ